MNSVISIYFDGGCSPNPGNKYGSYEVVLDNYPICKGSRIEFGHGTNNEAEFNALEAALKDLHRWSVITGFDLSSMQVKVETDSKILCKRLKKNRIHRKLKWLEASTRMFNLAENVLKYALLFQSFEVAWKPREHNVERFGH